MDSFRDRDEAGQALAGALDKSGVLPDTLVLALPRGRACSSGDCRTAGP